MVSDKSQSRFWIEVVEGKVWIWNDFDDKFERECERAMENLYKGECCGRKESAVKKEERVNSDETTGWLVWSVLVDSVAVARVVRPHVY